MLAKNLLKRNILEKKNNKKTKKKTNKTKKKKKKQQKKNKQKKQQHAFRYRLDRDWITIKEVKTLFIRF